MKATVSQPSATERVLEIEVPRERLDRIFDDKVKKYSREIRVNGFRPGNVPKQVIATRYKEPISAESLETLVDEAVKEACKQFPGRIVVGIDARDGLVAVEGWAKTSEVRALDLALKFEDCGVSAIVYTDINRDGTSVGLNVESTVDLAYALTTPVIASGGVSALSDLEELKREAGAGIEGVICGRALYDGRIEAKSALKLLAS